MNDPAVLRPGSEGEPVRDLQRRLVTLGLDLSGAEPGSFCDVTAAAVRAFQEARGLRVDGICGRQTWAALVESGYRLGDRLLYRRSPMLRGDDVLELQHRLNALGFDSGREDGILGDDTTRALTEFQRNMGLATDGVFGPATLDQLERVGSLAEGSVASVREREALRQGPHNLAGRRVFVAAAPGFEAVATSLVHGLTEEGASATLDTSGADDSSVAAEANRFGADLFVVLRAGDAPGCRCHYFASGRFRSEAGFELATSIAQRLARVLGSGGRRLRQDLCRAAETRMAAVLCEPVPEGDVEAMRELVTRGGDVARAVLAGILGALEHPSRLIPHAPAELHLRAQASPDASKPVRIGWWFRVAQSAPVMSR
ncbi:MAG: peptidoglycan-binding protein [Acidimicrobiia bacterium]